MAEAMRQTAPRPAPTRVFVDPQPGAGSCHGRRVRQALERHFPATRPFCEIHETGRDERLAELVREARRAGLRPGRRGRGRRHGLGGRQRPDRVGRPRSGSSRWGRPTCWRASWASRSTSSGACRLLAGAHGTEARIDAMRVGDRHYFTQVGVGIDALMIRDTRREAQAAVRPGRLPLDGRDAPARVPAPPVLPAIDGRKRRTRASQVVVANSGILGQPPFRWGPDIRPDDGRLDVCIVRARNLLDYLKLSWLRRAGQHRRSPNVRYLAARARRRHRHPPPAPRPGRRRDHRRDPRPSRRPRGRPGGRAGDGPGHRSLTGAERPCRSGRSFGKRPRRCLQAEQPGPPVSGSLNPRIAPAPATMMMVDSRGFLAPGTRRQQARPGAGTRRLAPESRDDVITRTNPARERTHW